jgi:hypothetical protein
MLLISETRHIFVNRYLVSRKKTRKLDYGESIKRSVGQLERIISGAKRLFENI